jgi:hypothetical protein
VSEQQAEQTSGEPGSLNAGPALPLSSHLPSEPVAAAAQDSVQQSANETPAVASPKLVPEQGAAAAAPKPEAAQPEAPKADATHSSGKVLIMSAGDRGWNRHDGAGAEAESPQNTSMFGTRRLAALAAVVVLAMGAGALGGALATGGLSHAVADDAAKSGNSALEASVARIDADMLTLKASVEQTSRTGTSQFNKTGDRLDKIEKAQAEPAAKLARLSEAVDKLRAASPAAALPVAAAAVAAKDVTGSIAPPATTAPKSEVGRLPTVEGWVLRDVANGGALIEGRRGIFEVYAGDPVPGLGRVDAIRRQDGRWVVVTSKGLIVAR